MTGFQNESGGLSAIDSRTLLQVRSAGVAVGVKSGPAPLALDPASLLQVRSAGVAVSTKG